MVVVRNPLDRKVRRRKELSKCGAPQRSRKVHGRPSSHPNQFEKQVSKSVIFTVCLYYLLILFEHSIIWCFSYLRKYHLHCVNLVNSNLNNSKIWIIRNLRGENPPFCAFMEIMYFLYICTYLGGNILQQLFSFRCYIIRN